MARRTPDGQGRGGGGMCVSYVFGRYSDHDIRVVIASTSHSQKAACSHN